MPQRKQAAAVNPKRRKPPKRLTKVQWEKLISEYEAGRLNQKAFCHKHQISVSSLHKWRKLTSPQSESHTIELAPFVEITPPSATPNQPEPVIATAQHHSDWQVELDLGRGVVLRLRGI